MVLQALKRPVNKERRRLSLWGLIQHLIAGRGGTQLERPGCRKVFNADTSEVKPNLGVVAYRTEELQPYVLNVVKK
ncbi:Aspartate aminotransferase, chloroplastic [Dendrobium catenatum]|uniref:Aspartate aminotransferase, chloroplastic n=1 Tax=Dendrobium catenatum TaxID=906689 RepID=A0A2I0VDV9_9ASPA|nr:Aspartate aminotransferase, chloroplastic [Dendrobium catenatum]